ncbi:hypothetical protein HU200_021754 [Digitaria exilis]|uniref:Uncharacterized protein n=1 Tax=Digitaria exilis TaxID=1010633 RepID=A0A835EZL0_9POAL|nr:hypothetical protein HU200_021754 [Digitaria exilis]
MTGGPVTRRTDDMSPRRVTGSAPRFWKFKPPPAHSLFSQFLCRALSFSLTAQPCPSSPSSHDRTRPSPPSEARGAARRWGSGRHFEGVKQHWARNFAFLDYFKKVYGRAEPLPKWSDADVEELIVPTRSTGPRSVPRSASLSPSLASPLPLAIDAESRKFALVGALVGATHLGGVAFKYSKAPHGSTMGGGICFWRRPWLRGFPALRRLPSTKSEFLLPISRRVRQWYQIQCFLGGVL